MCAILERPYALHIAGEHPQDGESFHRGYRGSDRTRFQLSSRYLTAWSICSLQIKAIIAGFLASVKSI
jgi:hypothetical protein